MTNERADSMLLELASRIKHEQVKWDYQTGDDALGLITRLITEMHDEKERAGAASQPSPPAEVGGVVERAEALVDCGCLDGGLSIVRELASALSAQTAEIERLRKERDEARRECAAAADETTKFDVLLNATKSRYRKHAIELEAALAAANARLEKAVEIAEKYDRFEEYGDEGSATAAVIAYEIRALLRDKESQ